MNASRLRALVEDLLKAEAELKIQEHLSALSSALSNFSSQPQSAEMQVEVSKKLAALESQVGLLKTRYEPVQLDDLAAIGALEFFSDSFVDSIKQSIANNPMTPAVVQQEVQRFLKRRSQYLQTLESTKKDLHALHIKAEPIKEGSAEIGFRIPSDLFKNELDGLIKELAALKRIIRAFSELATGAAQPIYVRQISTSSPLFFFELDPITIAAIGGVVTWALNTWKQVEEIRKLRSETSKNKAFTEKEVETFFGDKIKKTIEDSIQEKTRELVGSEKTGRRAEQYLDIKWALESLFARIERGMTVEIRFLPPPAAEAGAEVEPQAQAVDKAFEEIAQITPHLAFPAPEPSPVLALPPSEPPSAKTITEDAAHEASHPAERPKKAKRQERESTAAQ